MLKVSILSIGDELCIGQVINTNAAWIASKTTNLGCEVLLHSVIGDEKDLIIKELDRLLNFNDIVLITGGLGPTHDDITKSTLCEYFNDILIENEDVLNLVKDFTTRRGFQLNELNRSQALVPSKCKVLINKMGTAPGMLFEKNGKFIISMPGVPREMEYLMEYEVLPFIKNLLIEGKHEIVLFKSLMTAGIPESSLSEKIGNPHEFLNGATLAFLPSYRGVKLRIGVKADSMDSAKIRINEIEKIIKERAGKYIFAEGEDGLNTIVGDLLRKTGKTLAVAESCTGGMLGSAFTDIPGSSDYFLGGFITYSNDAKINLLGIDNDIILTNGVVSEECAKAMASGAKEKLKSDYALSITGIAGPDGWTIEKPVGTVWIGIAGNNEVKAFKYVFGNDRKVNRERSVGTALFLLYKKLTGISE